MELGRGTYPNYGWVDAIHHFAQSLGLSFIHVSGEEASTSPIL